MNTQLSKEEIIKLCFLNTTSIMELFLKKAKQVTYFERTDVRERINHLLQNFRRDKRSLLELFEATDDIPFKKLSFKETEADIVCWQSECFGNDWVSTQAQSRLVSLIEMLTVTETKAFLNKIKEN